MAEAKQEQFTWREFKGDSLLFKSFFKKTNKILLKTQEGTGRIAHLSDEKLLELRRIENQKAENQEIVIDVPNITSFDDDTKLIFKFQDKGEFKKQQITTN